MSYQFKKRESPRKALERIAGELIADMGQHLAHPDAEGIHDARRCGKMLRALVRLAGNGLKPPGARRVKRRIRDLAHLLAGSRDATVRMATFRLLSAPHSAGLDHRLADEADHEQHRQFSARAQQDARQAIKRIELAVGKLGWKSVDWKDVIAGIDRSYRQARKTFREYLKEETDETLHQWRKCSKDFMYHVRLLRKICPRKMGPLEKQLDRLTELLGLIHDLIVLNSFVRGLEWLGAGRIESVEKLIRERAKVHLEKACRCAKRIFEDRPGEFQARLERWSGVSK
jgi:CHAD domain-containing protein